ncbi:11153_t:CDS:2, partial [Dentiscutata erythropus]
LMATTENSVISLSEQFRIGQELYSKIENTELASTDQKYQEDVSSAIAYFSACAKLVDALDLFSSNETVDDINTTDLKFILVYAYLGDLMTKLIGVDRLELLSKAKDRRFVEEQSNGIVKDVAKKRMEKIERYKREKETKAKLEMLQKQLFSIGDDDKEDINREYILTFIDLFIQKSIEQLLSIKQEADLLNQMRKMEEIGQSSSVEMRDDNRIETVSRDHNGPLLSQDGRPLRPFVITSQREAIKERVFRPSWRLPTMTIDEYLEQEAQRGNIIQGGGEKSKSKTEVDDDEKAIDEETYKAREWDEFKDSNPRGWGNRMGKG